MVKSDIKFSRYLIPVVDNMPDYILSQMDGFVKSFFYLCFEKRDKEYLEPVIQDTLYLFSSVRVKDFDIDKILDLNLYAPFARDALIANHCYFENMNMVKQSIVKYVWDSIVEEIFHYYFVRYTLIPVDMNFIMQNMGKRIEDVVKIALKEEQK